MILNRGIFYKAGRDGLSWKEVCSELIRDPEMFYHWLYLGICLFGWLGHEFLYCALVRKGGRRGGEGVGGLVRRNINTGQLVFYM